MDGNCLEKVNLREGLYCFDMVEDGKGKFRIGNNYFNLVWIAIPPRVDQLHIRKMLIASDKAIRGYSHERPIEQNERFRTSALEGIRDISVRDYN